MSFLMVFSLTLVGMGDELEPKNKNTVEKSKEAEKKEKIAIYIGNNYNAETLNYILGCEGVKRFEKMIYAFDGTSAESTCCCLPTGKSTINAEAINNKTKLIKELFEVIKKEGTLSLCPSLPYSLMGKIFLMEFNDSKDFNQYFLDLKTNKLINWVATEEKAKD